MRPFCLVIALCLLCGSLAPAAAVAYSQGTPIPTDSRIKTFVYNENDVYRLLTHYGYQLNIEFGREEKIQTISVGDRTGWQITPAGNRLFVRGMEDEAHTNMTVITDKRAYQFDLYSAMPGQRDWSELVYVVRFYYPEEEEKRRPMPSSRPPAPQSSQGFDGGMPPQHSGSMPQPQMPMPQPMPMQRMPGQPMPMQQQAPMMPSYGAPAGQPMPLPQSQMPMPQHMFQQQMPMQPVPMPQSANPYYPSQPPMQQNNGRPGSGGYGSQGGYNNPMMAPPAYDRYRNHRAVEGYESQPAPHPPPMAQGYPGEAAPYGQSFSQSLPPLTAYPVSTPPSMPTAEGFSHQGHSGAVVSGDYTNIQYSYTGTKALLPDHIYDDGRMTYLFYPKHRREPEIYQVFDDGSERLLPINHTNQYLTIPGVYSRMTLRMGGEYACIYNEAKPPPLPS